MNTLINNSSLCFYINKIALLRESRQRDIPNLVETTKIMIAAGAKKVGLHQWSDKRHIKLDDIQELSFIEEIAKGNVELIVGGEAREELLSCISTSNAHVFTITPFKKNWATTKRGWKIEDGSEQIHQAVATLKNKCKVSLFLDPNEQDIRNALNLGLDGIELNCSEYANYHNSSRGKEALNQLLACANLIRLHGLQVSLAHDLNKNMIAELKDVIQPDRISVGHNFIAESLMSGLAITIKKYLENLTLNV